MPSQFRDFALAFQAQIYRHLVGGAPPVAGRVLSRVLQEDLARDFQDRGLGSHGFPFRHEEMLDDYGVLDFFWNLQMTG